MKTVGLTFKQTCIGCFVSEESNATAQLYAEQHSEVPSQTDLKGNIVIAACLAGGLRWPALAFLHSH